jgi:uncharacterized membrane protein
MEREVIMSFFHRIKLLFLPKGTYEIVRLLFWFWYSCGLLIMLLFQLPDRLRFANGVFLMLFGLFAAVIYAQGANRWRVTIGALLVGVAGFTAEFIGLQTGFPFGAYNYTNTLGLALLEVPIAIGFAWVGVTLTAALLASGAELGDKGKYSPLVGRLGWVGLKVRRALATGAWALLLDLVLDPTAAARGMWLWDSQQGFALYGVPWQNFVSWFVLAAIFSFFLPDIRTISLVRRRDATRLFQGMLLMFGLLALKAGLIGPAIIAVIGIVVSEWKLRR